LFPPIGQIRNEQELKEALKVPEWRLRNLYFIKDKDGKTVRFAPNEVQENFLKTLWYRNIVPKARQRGFSTLVQLMMLDTCLFVPNTDAAVIAQDEDTAKKIRSNKIKFAWDRLPETIQRMVPLITDNVTELKWANQSVMSVSTSVRGGTINFLHISEYGIVCLKQPEKAKEIQEGSLPAVPQTGIAVIESTVESPYGTFSDMVRNAQRREEQGGKLTKLDYRLHFASWWDSEEYEIDPDGVIISPKDHAYFERIEAQIGRSLSDRKRAWYVKIRDGDFGGSNERMWRQYPSTLEEAFTVAKDGLWLADQMALARKDGRICDLPLVQGEPVNTFWDIGTDDSTSIWLHQRIGLWDHFIGFIEGSGEPPSYYVRQLQQVREERKFVWGKHFLPHDGAKRNPQTETLKTYEDMLGELGLINIEIVPRTDDKNRAIDGMREEFNRYKFDEKQCAEGIKHLDGFSKVYNNSMGTWTGGIAKNGHDHAADALRQKSQAEEAGLMNAIGGKKKRPKRRNKSGMAA
jgi:hypothetical protein